MASLLIMPRYLIGIDLGTTNSALAFVDLQAKAKGGVRLQSFPIMQLVGVGRTEAQPLLPSFLYRPTAFDFPEGSIALPWDKSVVDVIGRFGREHGAKVPGRLVSSAKSWLCHTGVDRTAPLLPWGAPPDVDRLSPLAVTAAYLRHIVLAWNAHPGRLEEDYLQNCPVVLTVPASFDDVARNLTAESARQAGLKQVTLLEEPQAAFYCWLGMHTDTDAGVITPGMRCVVIDVGGGTSDLSLIRAQEEHGELSFQREAVGDHLLLGGDNMDLALAKSVEAKLSGKLDAGQFGSLVQAARSAKETLLGPKPPAEFPVTIVGKGRGVIAGAVTAKLTPNDVRTTLFDGFFPYTSYSSTPNSSSRSGLQEMGLPYVSDPAISKHLAAFLRQHLPEGSAPDAILFNGGVFQPQSLRDRVLDVMTPWFSSEENPWKPVVLTNPSLDLAVAWGAAYSAWLTHTGGQRIGGGSARSYYIGVQSDQQGQSQVICVVPRRMTEGTQIEIPKPELELSIGEPVLFPLYTSTVRSDDQPGDVLTINSNQLLELPPLHTVLRGGKRSGAKKVPVTLSAKSTEIGTLELACVSRENNRWKLEFNLRDVVNRSVSREQQASESVTVQDVYDDSKSSIAGKEILGCFQKNTPIPTELSKQLEAALEGPRLEWPTALCRRLWDDLNTVSDQRTKSPAHLARWYNLAGFVLRPGFGDPIDRYRVEALWKILTSTASGAISGGNKLVVPEGGADYWIMWRRVAGGLNGALQQALFARLKLALLPSKGKPAPKMQANELAEMWRAAASLERLDVKTKEYLGDNLMTLMKRKPAPSYVFWSLTRIGARVPFYGPLNSIVHPDVASRWITELLDYRPDSENDLLAWAFCLAQLARKCGMRGVDLDDNVSSGVVKLLQSIRVPQAWSVMVETVQTNAVEESSRLFGESLPIGLKLTV